MVIIRIEHKGGRERGRDKWANFITAAIQAEHKQRLVLACLIYLACYSVLLLDTNLIKRPVHHIYWYFLTYLTFKTFLAIKNTAWLAVMVLPFTQVFIRSHKQRFWPDSGRCIVGLLSSCSTPAQLHLVPVVHAHWHCMKTSAILSTEKKVFKTWM